MSDSKKYYYLKLKENFFEQDNIKILESMENGYIYSNIIMKLFLKSLKFEGKLMMTERIPYSPEKVSILSKVINHNSDNVKQAIKIGVELDIITIFDSGEMFMSDIQNYIGKSSSEADRKRQYRSMLESGNILGDGQMSDKYPPEIELEKEIEIEKEPEKEKPSPRDKEINSEMKDIYIIWIRSNLTKHSSKVLSNKIKTKHYKQIKDYGKDEVIKAVKNYAIVLQQDKYYWNHKYTFWDFIGRGLENFLDESDPLSNYLKSESKLKLVNNDSFDPSSQYEDLTKYKNKQEV
jgi:predicted phage replisome organizer